MHTDSTPLSPSGPEPATRRRLRYAMILFALFLASLIPRVYGGLNFGRDLEGPNTFTLINHDEGGSCRAVLSDFPYPTFVGRQMIFIAELLGYPAPAPGSGREGRAYCHSRPLIELHRIYSAVLGALTVVILGLISLMIWPTRPQIAWTASGLLALSNFHLAHSHSGTVDVPQVFFLYLLACVLTAGLVTKSKLFLYASPVFLIFAIWTKLYLFAVFSYAFLIPSIDFKQDYKKLLLLGIAVGIGAVFLIGLEPIAKSAEHLSAMIWGIEKTRFGSGYANIGLWRRWIRNSVNIPVVHIVGLGLPAFVFAVYGLRRMLRDKGRRLLWLVHAPFAVYLIYMLVLAPVTYYRHYLPFFPLVALCAAYGWWESRWSQKRVFLAVFFIWPALLSLDSELNYRFDPRRKIASWYEKHGDPKTMVTFYVNPPSTARQTGMLDLDRYNYFGPQFIQQAEYVILSENWYDTSYPNELNGPIAWRPEWLIKTRPDYVRTYRRILDQKDPNLKLEAEYNLRHFMPEFLIHRYFYGSFQLFVGDLKIYRVVSHTG